MNLISLFKLYQSTNVTVLAIPSLNFFTIIRFQIFPIPLAQLAKNIYKLINHHIAFIWVMQTHWMILLKCNTHAQDNIFHHIWFKNAITKLFWSYAIPSCLGYISYHLSERCNTMWTHWPYHIQLSYTCITFIKVMQYPKDKIQISYPTIFTSTLPLLG